MPCVKGLTGQRFTRLTVKGRAESAGRPAWLCQCDCGNQCIAIGENLRSGNTRSCGCLREQALRESRLHHKPFDLTGAEVGDWVVIERAGTRPDGGVLWRCLCNCGNEGIVRSSQLMWGRSMSCGCGRGRKSRDA